MFNLKCRAGITAGWLALLAFGSGAHAQNANQLPATVVTADRSPEPITNTASAISVVDGQTITQSNPGSLVDALRSVPRVSTSPRPADLARRRASGCAVPIPGLRRWC